MAQDFDWCSFYALFYNDKGLKCKLNIPDTVLFRYGQLSAWWATNKEGSIQRHTSQSTSIEAIRTRFLNVANEDENNYSKFVAISRLGDGKPQLLRVMAFNQLCELLFDRLESGHQDNAPDIETPTVLQAFIQPYQDLRYVTTYINNGHSVTCHTFQRKYSKRYTPMSAATAAQIDTRDADIIMSAGEEGDLRRAEIEAHNGAVEPGLRMQLRKLTAHLVKYIERAHGLTLGGIVCEYIRDVDGKVYLLSVMRTEWSSNARGHGAGSLQATALTRDPQDLSLEDDQEFMMEQDGQYPGVGSSGDRPYLLTDLHSTAGAGVAAEGQGHGSGSHPDSPPGSGLSAGEGAAGVEGGYAVPGGLGGRSGSLTRPMTARPAGSRGGAQAGDPLHPTPSPGHIPAAGAAAAGTTAGALSGLRSSLSQYPGGQGRVGAVGVAVANTWPSAQHEASLSPVAPARTIPRPATAHAGASPTSTSGQHQGYGFSGEVGSGGMYQPLHNRTQGAAGHPPRARSAHPASHSHSSCSGVGLRASASGLPYTTTSAPGLPRSQSPTANPGGAPLGFGSTTHRSTFTSPDRPYSARGLGAAYPSEFSPVPGGVQPPPVGALTARGDHVNGGPRGAPLMVSQLQREVESLRDQLIYQHELAEASAAKVRILEKEKEVVTSQFDRRRHELEHLLAATRAELDTTRADRDRWKARAEGSEARAAELSSEHGTLSSTLATERATTLSALKEYQDRDAAQKERIQQLESEVLRMSETLKMETTAVNSLKRQLLEFSEIAERHKATLRDAQADPALVEVLDRTAHLLAGQTNPTGEQYSLQKILQHYHSDLRSVFLYYSQLEKTFTDYWPPSMTFAQWMLFCKDSETSDIRAGARIRSNQHFRMLHPNECEAIYTKYARPDEHAARAGLQEPVLSYESFLAAIVQTAGKLRRPEVPYLSEALREYILRYLARAQRITPHGINRGAVRQALEGTATGPGGSPRGAAPGAAGQQGGGALGDDGGGLSQGASMDDLGASPRASTGAYKPRVSSANSRKTGKSGQGGRPGSAASRSSMTGGGKAVGHMSPARMLHEAGNSAVMKELALLSLSSPMAAREVVRTGGGYQVA